MKFPQHLLLDYFPQRIEHSAKYWPLKFTNQFTLHVKTEQIFFFKLFLLHNNSNTFFMSQNLNKWTLKTKIQKKAENLIKKNKNFVKKIFKNRFKVKNKNLYASNIYRNTYYLLENKTKFKKSNLAKMYHHFSLKINQKTDTGLFFKNLFDINFLRKEKIYTKLKYSRVPQYDIVSGASAALLAGFLGFLICEKFGFELLDSGDFYFLFMYFVFLSFSLRLFIKLLSFKTINWNILSLKWFLNYYLALFNFLKSFFIK